MQGCVNTTPPNPHSYFINKQVQIAKCSFAKDLLAIMNYYVIENDNNDFIPYLSWHHFILLSDVFVRYKLYRFVSWR